MDAKSFILAGNATFTLVNEESGNRFTFKVVRPDEDTPHFVKVLTGSDNEDDFTFLGTIFNKRDFRHGRRSRITPEAQSAKAFNWAWPRILSDGLPPQVKVFHEGRCGRCGRKLTVPESIESGIGPECSKRMEL